MTTNPNEVEQILLCKATKLKGRPCGQIAVVAGRCIFHTDPVKYPDYDFSSQTVCQAQKRNGGRCGQVKVNEMGRCRYHIDTTKFKTF